MTVYQVALIVLTGAGFAATATFVALYARSRWWATAAGRHMMTLSAVLAGTFGLMLLSRWVGGLPRPVWLVALSSLDVVLWGQVLLLRRAQRATGKNDPPVNDGSTT